MDIMEKDKQQDMEIEKLKDEVAEIKLVTHGSQLLQWNGIISEHKNLEKTMLKVAQNSGFTAKLVGGLTAAATLGGIILGIVKMM